MRTPSLVLALLIAGHAAAQGADKPVEVDIPAQPLETALLALSRQAGVQISAASADISAVQAPQVSGKMSAQTALERLVAANGLRVERVGEVSFALAQVTQAVNETDRDTEMGAEKSARGPVSTTTECQPADPKSQSAEPQGPVPAASPKPVQKTTATDRDRGQLGVQEVIVTAQKREERLLDVPQSVTVLSADSVVRSGASQLRDFADLIPGLTITTAGAGWTQITLRGVTTGYDIGQTVGIYVDEIPYGSSSAFADGPRATLDMSLFDLDRIEVLRGPQGTLYGASSMGGLIKYVTKRPDLAEFATDAHGRISSTRDGGESYSGAATLNLPLAFDKTALRTTGFFSHDGGYITNRALGAENANRSDTYGARADLLIAGSDELTVRLVGFLQNVSRDGEGTADYTFSGTPLNDPLEQYRALAEPFSQHFRLASATVTYDLVAATLASITSYQTSTSQFVFDLSPGYVPLLSLCPPFCRSYSAVGVAQRVSTDKVTQELRLASSSRKPIGWLAGAFFTREDSENEQEFVLRDATGAAAPNDLYEYSGPSRYEEYAVFGNVTYQPTTRFDVSAGIRLARNRQEVAQIGSGLLIGSRPTAKSEDDVLNYLANASYRFGEHANAYARYATGYRAGGPNFLTFDPTTGLPVGKPSFEADRLKSYEVGFKGETADRRIGLDVAVYHIDWDDLQLSVVRGGFSAIANAPGGATIDGAELALTGRVSRAFTLTGTFSYQDARLSQADQDLGAAKGERLPNVPRFTMALHADYELALGGLQPKIGLTASHVGERRASFDGSAGFPQYRLPSYTRVDTRVGLPLGRFDIALFVHNLLNTRGQLSARTFQGLPRPAMLQPLTVGLTVSAHY